MSLTLPTLSLLAKYQRTFPFDIDCAHEGHDVWKQLADQVGDSQLPDATPLALREDGSTISKGQLREKLSHVVALDICDSGKQSIVSINFLELFPQIQKLRLGPHHYEGGRYFWNVKPTSFC